MNDEKYMRLAINTAREGIENGQAPFGACIVKDDELISCTHNNVWEGNDITAHAEIRAIRDACRKLKAVDLSGCTMYSTCEPCPMCFSACHWAKISKIVYGAGIEDAKDIGFNELAISNKKMKDHSNSPVEITKGFLKEECVLLFKKWSEKVERKLY